jgi:hypothetical protein
LITKEFVNSASKNKIGTKVYEALNKFISSKLDSKEMSPKVDQIVSKF